MLQNEYLVAKIGVDTAENEPSKVCKFANLVLNFREVNVLPQNGAACDPRSKAEAHLHSREASTMVGGARSGQTAAIRATTNHSFRGPFSAVSTPIFASKHSFCIFF